jgi:hypothetical protein
MRCSRRCDPSREAEARPSTSCSNEGGLFLSVRLIGPQALAAEVTPATSARNSSSASVAIPMWG